MNTFVTEIPNFCSALGQNIQTTLKKQGQDKTLRKKKFSLKYNKSIKLLKQPPVVA